MAVIKEMLKEVSKRQNLGDATDQRQQNHPKSILQRAVFEELRKHDIRDGIFFQLDDEAHAVTVGFIPDIGDTCDFLLFDELDNFFNEPRFVDLVGNLRNDNSVPTTLVRLLDIRFGPCLSDPLLNSISTSLDVHSRFSVKLNYSLIHNVLKR